MPKQTRNINRQIAKGSAWMVLFKILEKSISIVSTIVLARLLVPEDFGLVTMAMMVVAFLELMRAFGFDMALIQNQKANHDHYNTAWTFNILTASLVAILLLALSPAAASFYEDNRLTEVIPFLALGVFISGLENIGVVAFRKELTFHKEFAYMLSKKLISFVTGLSLAFYFRNYWALIGAFIITNIGTVILSFTIHHYRPRLCLKQWRSLIGFSGWLLLNNFLSFFSQKLPSIIIGKLSGAGPLGIFTISKDIANTTSAGIVLPINRAAFPGYSKLNSDLPALKNSLLSTLGMIALIIIPASSGFASIVPVMVPTLLGEKWLDAIPVMQVITFSSLVFSLANISTVYLALGKPRITTIIMIIRVAIFIPMLIYATNTYGIIGAAWASLLTAIIAFPITLFPALRLLNISFSELSSRYIRPVIAASLTYGLIHLYYVRIVYNEALSYTVLDLIGMILIGLLVFPTSILLMWLLVGRPAGAEKQVISSFYEKLSRSK